MDQMVAALIYGFQSGKERLQLTRSRRKRA